ncbi:hypothetical protein C1645_738927 [Glomus cerebriforme]|uniref:Uncharacterized protein n=1 Tax=Glomus cerebriforme TaxID=658196 RepID=A0A397SWK5_9GLOM|nr:hypothetical protein C1645_738927 [Glomus cerebriforme]
MSVKSSQSYPSSRKLRSHTGPSLTKTVPENNNEINKPDTMDNNNMDLDDNSQNQNNVPNLTQNTENNTTKAINNTIDFIASTAPPVENTNYSIHNPNIKNSSLTSLSKGKNKETHGSFTNPEIIPAVKIAHTFNEISSTPQITNNKDTASNSDMEEIDIADIHLSQNKNQFIAFTPLYTLPNKSILEIKQLVKNVFNKNYKETFEGFLVIDNITQQLGPISSYEILHKKNFKKGNRIIKPFYSQLKIEFANQKSIEKIITDNIWSIPYESYHLRILPNETKSDEYIRRSQWYYKLTGIPVTMNNSTLSVFLDKIKAKTCTFTYTSPKRLTKSAYIHVDPKDYINKNQTINLNPSSIYVLHPKSNHCTVCGSPKHDFNHCNNLETIKSAYDKFNHIIPLSEQPWQQKFDGIIKSSRKQNNNHPNITTPNNNLKTPTGNQRSTTNDRSHTGQSTQTIIPQQYHHLLQTITTQTNTINELKKMVDTLQQQVTQLTKETTFQKENITQINVKSDILINKLEDLTSNIKLNSHSQISQTQNQRKR